jgi:serine protease Do
MAKEFNNLERNRRSIWRRAGVGTAAVVLVSAVAGAAAWQAYSSSPSLVAPAQAQTQPKAAPYSFADLAEQVRPAVVSVEVSGRRDARDRFSRRRGDDNDNFFGLPEDHPLREFFRRFGERMPDRPRPSRSAGSGFFISADGYIVTNNHVVENADKIEVVMGDEQARYEARLVGTDPRTDIALLKIESNGDFPHLEFSDQAARVGDWVLAVGNPFGLGGSVSAGIVSARGRDIGSSPYDYLQLDAAINKGNSGGPAVNLEGKIVGVNTAIFSPSGGNVGIAFAIPAGLVQQIVEDLKEDGTVSRGWLGVTIQDVDEDLAAGLGMDADDPHGALITNILADGPAAGSELRVGDAITQVNGERVKGSRDLARKIAAISPGTETMLTVMRDGSKQQVQLSLGTFPSPDRMAALEKPSTPSSLKLEDLGITLAPADSAREEYNDDRGDRRRGSGDNRRGGYDDGEAGDAMGVRIASVEPGSVAADKGLRAGDVIAEVGGQKVYTPRDIRRSLASGDRANSGVVVMRIQRNDQQRFVALPINKKR